MFHRVEDWRRLSCLRYFRMAERLVHRPGAVQAMLLADVQPRRRAAFAPPSAVPLSLAGAREPVTVVDDVATLAAMSQQPGFPSIGYSGEG